MPSNYGKSVGPSPLVSGGEVVQIGLRPGQLDAHVRPNCLVLRCEANMDDQGNNPIFEFYFNDEDAEILMKVAAIAARKSEPYWLHQIDRVMEEDDGV